RQVTTMVSRVVSEQRQVTTMVSRMVSEQRTEMRTVYTCVPSVEQRVVTRHVTVCTPVTEMACRTVDRGHWECREEVCAPGFMAKCRHRMSGECGEPCPEVRTRKVWCANLVTEQYPVTRMVKSTQCVNETVNVTVNRMVASQQPYTFTVQRCIQEPVQQTITVNRCIQEPVQQTITVNRVVCEP